MSETPARRWARLLGEWAIPAEILDAAPESPWGFPPGLFAIDPQAPVELTVSHRVALGALRDGGAVLDVGCGGGAASVPLAPPATALTGVDAEAAMLERFAAAAAAAGAAHREVLGRWPDVAGEVPDADVAVCNHVAYNVADIAPFLTALTGHARRLVVVELTGAHPQSPLNPLWQRFWGLDRPVGPTAEDFVEVVGSLGWEPQVRRWSRPPRKAAMGRADYVAFVRRRLCLPPARDAEVDAALGAEQTIGPAEVATVSWEPPGRG